MHTSLSEFVRQHSLKTYKRNETLIFQDDQPDIIYYIKSGFVKGYDIDSQGTEQLLWLGSAGDFVPLSWIFNTEPTVPYFFSALSAVEAYEIRRSDIQEFLKANGGALQEITQELAERLTSTYHHLNAAAKARAEEKILYSLYFLSRRFSDLARHTVRQVSLPITHKDIANLIGLSRETVSQELKKLKDAGYINYDKYQFTIHQDKLEGIIETLAF
ncbi:MAG TPA: Crp/Fnr family transcriptional regulator [Candidatus Saccharimonadales bacterium]